MGQGILEKHQKNLKGKFSEEEFLHVKQILNSAEDFLQKSNKWLFLSVIAVIFIMSMIVDMIILPFKLVFSPLLFYGCFGISAVIIGSIILFFIQTSLEFKKQHYLAFIGIIVILSFVSLFLSHLLLSIFLKRIITGPIWSEWKVSIVVIIGYLIPFVCYFAMEKKL